jgi:hypothetical protein
VRTHFRQSGRKKNRELYILSFSKDELAAPLADVRVGEGKQGLDGTER